MHRTHAANYKIVRKKIKDLNEWKDNIYGLKTQQMDKKNVVDAVIEMAKQDPRSHGFIGEFYQTFKEELTSMLLKLFHVI